MASSEEIQVSAPLEGLRVLDMGWVMVGPVTGRYLADLGADVVKLESSRRVDPLRTLGPFKDGKPGLERSISYHNLNAGKRSLTVDVKDARGREAILRLVEWADVVIESFSPGVLDELDLGYALLKERNPAVILVSTCLLGQTGPHARGTSGVGTMGASMSGASLLLGWPGHTPCGTYGPWTDAIAPRFIVSSILAALHRRRTTGEGCHIDVAQAEAGIQFLSPAWYQYAANGTVPERRGHAGSPLKAPQGIFPCTGKDRWIAIDASADAAWRALREAIDGPLLDATFDTLIGRLRHREGLEKAIGAWTATRDAESLERSLQAAGVPAHVVSNSSDLARDPELTGGHYRKIDDPVVGEATIEGPRFRLGRTPTRETRRGPRIGEHTHEILRDLCRYEESTIADLKAAGVLV
jgi:benzylsuccinate CoA-transferase BbsF subunit